MILNKNNKKTFKTFTRYINDCKRGDKVLLGVYYRNPLEQHILADPHFEVKDYDEENKLGITITLKADEDDYNALDLLNTILVGSDVGHVDSEDSNNEISMENAHKEKTRSIGYLFSDGTEYGDTQNFKMELVFDKDKPINQSSFSINKRVYTQLELQAEGSIGERLYKHSLFLLFKDKEYDFENFYTIYSGETLSKGNGIKFLDCIANENITSKFLGAVFVNTDKGINGSLYGTDTLPELVKSEDGIYAVYTSSGQVVFPEHEIKNVEITSNNQGASYTITVYTSLAEITIIVN